MGKRKRPKRKERRKGIAKEIITEVVNIQEPYRYYSYSQVHMYHTENRKHVCMYLVVPGTRKIRAPKCCSW